MHLCLWNLLLKHLHLLLHCRPCDLNDQNFLLSNIIALIACIIATLKIFSTRSINENLRSEILKTQISINDLKLAVEEAKKGQIDKLAREKRKNKELEDADLTSKDEINDLTRKRDELKVSLDEKSKRRDEVMASIQKVKVSLAGIDKEIETLRNSVRVLSSGIPILQEGCFFTTNNDRI